MLNTLIDKNSSEAKRFAISKLAKIIHDCVEWNGVGLRQDNDWFTAEEYINKYVSEEGIRNLTEKYLILSAYMLLRKEQPQLPDISNNIIHKFWGFHEEFNNIRKVVRSLPDEQITSLMEGINTKEISNYQDLFLGRDIWDFYQETKRIGILPTKGYGRILFH